MKKAVGLVYTRGSEAPVVNSKGSGRVAEKIIEIAKYHGIHIYEDKSLTEILYSLDIDETIPEELYSVIAEILIYVYKADKKQKL